MALKPLTIVNGIIQDKEIDGIPVHIQIVKPKGIRNVRSLIKMKEIIGITNHNTANTHPTATDEQHARYLQNVEDADTQYVSVPFFVDDDSITQCVPIDEVCFHAGDGKGNGNYKTIGVEICENGNHTKAELNAQRLNAALILTYPHFRVFKHQDWSGKFCPRVILSRPDGWTKYKQGIFDLVNASKSSTINLNGDKVENNNIPSDFAIIPVNWAVVEGLSDGKNPKQPATREQVITMLYRFYKLIESRFELKKPKQ